MSMLPELNTKPPLMLIISYLNTSVSISDLMLLPKFKILLFVLLENMTIVGSNLIITIS
jgi:hypothetical protein